MTCKQCLFWKTPHKKPDEELAKGFCKRYPPVYDSEYTKQTIEPYIASMVDSCCFSFPLTDEDEWCGEFSQALNITVTINGE